MKIKIRANFQTDGDYSILNYDSYENEPNKINMCRIGTYHYLHVKIKDGNYIITKEWYTDPFADSLNLENIKSEDIKNYIINHEEIHPTLTKEQEKAIEYAHRYCGAAADEEYGLKFNPKYKDFNGDGGDCANFASQIMYESGRFKKNCIWNYEKGSATKAWVNAQGFKNYIINSGRGSYIAKGSYEEVYREAYANKMAGHLVTYADLLAVDNEIKALESDNAKLKAEIRNLKSSLEIAKSASPKGVTNVDLLKRISDLEKVVYGEE